MVSTVLSLGAAERAIVWLDGEHDIATVAVLADTLAKAISADDGDLIVDLSGVTFLSTATIDELLRVQGYLLRHNRHLLLRSPSRPARRVLDLCGLQFISTA